MSLRLITPSLALLVAFFPLLLQRNYLASGSKGDRCILVIDIRPIVSWDNPSLSGVHLSTTFARCVEKAMGEGAREERWEIG